MTETTQRDRRAVIIEDDPEIAELLAVVLAQAGFHTFVATDGMQGLDLVREHDPMLTTLDVNLPGIDGFEVVRRVRSFSSTYVIMLSARRDEIDTLTGLNAGADDYVAKPFRPRELRARIEAMVRRRELAPPSAPAAAPAEPEADQEHHDEVDRQRHGDAQHVARQLHDQPALEREHDHNGHEQSDKSHR